MLCQKALQARFAHGVDSTVDGSSIFEHNEVGYAHHAIHLGEGPVLVDVHFYEVSPARLLLRQGLNHRLHQPARGAPQRPEAHKDGSRSLRQGLVEIPRRQLYHLAIESMPFLDEPHYPFQNPFFDALEFLVLCQSRQALLRDSEGPPLFNVTKGVLCEIA